MTTHKSSTSIKKAQSASKDPNHDKLWRVNTLPPEVYQRTYEMLKRHSPRTVAELLQEDGFHTDIKGITLAHILEKFRSEKIPQHQLLNPYILERLTSEIKKNVNVFSEMSDLIALQRSRIRKALLAEEESGQLAQETNKQLHLQARMIKIYGDLGIKAGLMNEFINTFLRENTEGDECMVMETRDLFWRILEHKQKAGKLKVCLDDITNCPDDLLAQ